jgi:hypothetical protein
MPAFLVSTYHLPDQAIRLVHRLSAVPGATVLIHHDRAASDASFAILQAGVRDLPNVVMLPRQVCRYATFDHVRVTLAGMSWLVEQDVAFDHFVLMTGQCYPIRPLDSIASWFAERPGRSIIEVQTLPHPTWPDGGYNRVDAWVLALPMARVPAPIRKVLPKRAGWLAIPKPALLRHRLGGSLDVHVPAGVGTLYGGLGYWALARDHVHYVHAHKAPYERFFRHGYIPDELFFQTILMNSSHREEIDSERIHLVDFHRQGGMNPYIWRSEDVATLQASDRPFARKFDVRVDADVLDLIDTELLGV